MQIVIKISEEDYKALKQGHVPFNVLNVIMNGVPLPKGHGALIDVDALVGKIHGVRSISAVIDAPILIPAYKEI